MRSFARIAMTAVILTTGIALGGCEDQRLLEMFDTKKKLPGDRKPVFPEGVPGVQQGVPPELVKGYSEPADVTSAPVVPETKAEEEPKPKPKPKPVRTAAPKPAPAPAPRTIRPVQPDPNAPQPAAADPMASRWPSQPAAQQPQQPPPPAQPMAMPPLLPLPSGPR